MEQRQDFLLQVPAHIDQQIAATDQIEPGERRVFDQVLLRKDQHVAEFFADAVGRAVRLRREKPRQPLRQNVGRDAGGIETGAGLFNGLAIDVRGEHLHLETPLHPFHVLLQEDGDGIGLLSAGTARHPHADRGGCVLARKKQRDDLFLQRRECLGVAEEPGHADQQIAKEGLHFGRSLLQVADVLAQSFDLLYGHPPLDAAIDRVWLVL